MPLLLHKMAQMWAEQFQLVGKPTTQVQAFMVGLHDDNHNNNDDDNDNDDDDSNNNDDDNNDDDDSNNDDDDDDDELTEREVYTLPFPHSL